GAGGCAVEVVGERADDEERAAQPEEELLVALLEAHQERSGKTERDARERQHVGGQLRLCDPAHRALQHLAGGLCVLLLDPVELAPPCRLRAGGRGLFAHACRRRSRRVRLRTSPGKSARTKRAATSSQEWFPVGVTGK